jgi:hypothetical protein
VQKLKSGGAIPLLAICYHGMVLNQLSTGIILLHIIFNLLKIIALRYNSVKFSFETAVLTDHMFVPVTECLEIDLHSSSDVLIKHRDMCVFELSSMNGT